MSAAAPKGKPKDGVGKTRMKAIVQKLLKADAAGWFHQPIDEKTANALHYFDRIKNPMDLGTVQANLKTAEYTDREAFDDIRLTFANAITFNPPDHDCYIAAQKLDKKFVQLYKEACKEAAVDPAIWLNGVAVSPSSSGTVPPKATVKLTFKAAAPSAERPLVDPAQVHITSANRDRFRSIIQKCREKDIQGYFLEPVDPVALGIPTYFDRIKHPMALSDVQHNLDSGKLKTAKEFNRDMRLIWDNALTFNLPDDVVYVAAHSLGLFYDGLFHKLLTTLAAEVGSAVPVSTAAASPPKGPKIKFKSEASMPPPSAVPAPSTIDPEVAKSLQSYSPDFEMPAKSFDASVTLRKRMQFILDHLAKLPAADAFKMPVDTTMFPGYLQLVKRPMDLGTMKTNLKQGEYDGKTASFTQDLAQIWGNCQTFNEHTSLLYLISQRLDSLSRTMTQRYLVDTPFVPKVEMAPPAAPLGSSAAAKPGASSTAPLPVAPDVAAVVAKFAPNFVMPLRHFTTSHSAKERMQFIVDHVAGLDAAQDFVQPVDLAMFSDYLQHVTTPMDLSTVKKKLKTGAYANSGQRFLDDMLLIWSNCQKYNQPNSILYLLSQRLDALTRKMVKEFLGVDSQPPPLLATTGLNSMSGRAPSPSPLAPSGGGMMAPPARVFSPFISSGAGGSAVKHEPSPVRPPSPARPSSVVPSSGLKLRINLKAAGGSSTPGSVTPTISTPTPIGYSSPLMAPPLSPMGPPPSPVRASSRYGGDSHSNAFLAGLSSAAAAGPSWQPPSPAAPVRTTTPFNYEAALYIVDDLLRQKRTSIFAQPVDPVSTGATDYYEKIANPMDLGTVRQRVVARSYATWEDFESDVRLIFENARWYNGPLSQVTRTAEGVSEKFEALVRRMRDGTLPVGKKDIAKAEARRILDALDVSGSGSSFLAKTDVEVDQAPDYYAIITEPMDLATVRQKMNEGEYERDKPAPVMLPPPKPAVEPKADTGGWVEIAPKLEDGDGATAISAAAPPTDGVAPMDVDTPSKVSSETSSEKDTPAGPPSAVPGDKSVDSGIPPGKAEQLSSAPALPLSLSSATDTAPVPLPSPSPPPPPPLESIPAPFPRKKFNFDAFIADLRLIFSNALKYWEPRGTNPDLISAVCIMSKELDVLETAARERIKKEELRAKNAASGKVPLNRSKGKIPRGFVGKGLKRQVSAGAAGAAGVANAVDRGEKGESAARKLLSQAQRSYFVAKAYGDGGGTSGTSGGGSMSDLMSALQKLKMKDKQQEMMERAAREDGSLAAASVFKQEGTLISFSLSANASKAVRGQSLQRAAAITLPEKRPRVPSALFDAAMDDDAPPPLITPRSSKRTKKQEPKPLDPFANTAIEFRPAHGSENTTTDVLRLDELKRIFYGEYSAVLAVPVPLLLSEQQDLDLVQRVGFQSLVCSATSKLDASSGVTHPGNEVESRPDCRLRYKVYERTVAATQAVPLELQAIRLVLAGSRHGDVASWTTKLCLSCAPVDGGKKDHLVRLKHALDEACTLADRRDDTLRFGHPLEERDKITQLMKIVDVLGGELVAQRLLWSPKGFYFHVETCIPIGARKAESPDTEFSLEDGGGGLPSPVAEDDDGGSMGDLEEAGSGKGADAMDVDEDDPATELPGGTISEEAGPLVPCAVVTLLGISGTLTVASEGVTLHAPPAAMLASLPRLDRRLSDNVGMPPRLERGVSAVQRPGLDRRISIVPPPPISLDRRISGMGGLNTLGGLSTPVPTPGIRDGAIFGF